MKKKEAELATLVALIDIEEPLPSEPGLQGEGWRCLTCLFACMCASLECKNRTRSPFVKQKDRRSVQVFWVKQGESVEWRQKKANRKSNMWLSPSSPKSPKKCHY